jgi:hypothetical protein
MHGKAWQPHNLKMSGYEGLGRLLYRLVGTLLSLKNYGK